MKQFIFVFYARMESRLHSKDQEEEEEMSLIKKKLIEESKYKVTEEKDVY